MGLVDMIKDQLTKQVDKHGDKVAKGMNKTGEVVKKKAQRRKGGPESQR